MYFNIQPYFVIYVDNIILLVKMRRSNSNKIEFRNVMRHYGPYYPLNYKSEFIKVKWNRYDTTFLYRDMKL